MCVWKEDIPVILPDGTILEPMFNLRPDYSTDELEHLCDREITKAQQRRGVNPDLPPTEDDISDILESCCEDVDTGTEFPPELGYVEGDTQLRDDGIFVNIRAGLPENRRKSTKAHECGHVLTLREPYERAGNFRKPGTLLFRGCLASSRDWKERAANECMGALLMPEKYLRSLFGEPPHDPEKRLASDSKPGLRLIHEVSNVFQCSPAAARIRLMKKRYLVARTQRQFHFRGRVQVACANAPAQSPFNEFLRLHTHRFGGTHASTVLYTTEQLLLF